MPSADGTRLPVVPGVVQTRSSRSAVDKESGMHGAHDRTIRLRDGRTLGYAEYGAPDGMPVIYAHGGLSCRLDVETGASSARESGIRLISVDRPGIGLSGPKPGRVVADWATDIAELTDQLGICAFAAIGWSMGGQYA